MPYRLKVIAAWAAATAALAAVTAGAALAETVYADDRTALRARAGEQARIVVRVDDGERLEVIERDGRWIRVQYQGQSGWVTRTSVRSADGEDATGQQERRARERQREERRARERQREERRARERQREERRARERQREERPLVVTSDRSEVYAAPDPGADVAFVVSAGDEVAALERRGRWFRARSDDGETGWIRAQDVSDPDDVEGPIGEGDELEGEGEPGPGSGPDPSEVEGEERERSEAARAVGPAREAEPTAFAGVGLGATSVGLDYATETPASASGLSSGVALRGGVSYPIAGAFAIGAQVHYAAQVGLGDLDYDADGEGVDGPSFRFYDLHVDTRARYAYGDGGGVWASAGMHYNSLFVTELGNPPSLPREELWGLTAGLGIDIPLGARARAELSGATALAGTHRQTAGMRDGDDLASYGALWGSIGAVYHVAESYALDFRYTAGHHRSRWGGASERMAGEADTARRDLRHHVSAGVRASF